ncbi:hypothetical protein FRB95_006946 [Tulasnella sp. JGI-2019a]|nr:hypothetical protein FRB95_006946 [Tulasnella sp. JGI-2019a]
MQDELRTALQEWLSPPGDSLEDGHFFIQGVHRFGFAFGRQNDRVWMADYAHGCLPREALKWFESLNDEVKKDWSLLRPAIVEWFKQNKVTVDESAAACGRNSGYVGGQVDKARVKVVRANGTVLGYVAPLAAGGGYLSLVTTTAEALVLNIPKEYAKRKAAATIQTVVGGVSDPYLCVISSDDGYWYFCPSQNEKTYESRVWSVKKLGDSTEELCAEWPWPHGGACTLLTCSFDSES